MAIANVTLLSLPPCLSVMVGVKEFPLTFIDGY